MLIIVGLLLSIGASIGTYYGFGLFDKSLWYLFLLIPFVITFFIIYLNLYWGIVLIGIAKYRKIVYPKKVSKYHLFNVKLVSQFVLALNGVKAKKIGNKQWPQEPGLFLFNHVSDYDPWVLYTMMKGRYAFVGKKALRDIIMVRCIASSIGTLYVDNGDKELNYEMVDRAVEYITEKETSVVIAPEGTRNFTGDLLPFKHGGFNIAKRAKCPIYFIGISGMENAVNKRKGHIAKVKVELFGTIKPEEYEGKTAGEIAVMCENKYRSYFKQ